MNILNKQLKELKNILYESYNNRYFGIRIDYSKVKSKSSTNRYIKKVATYNELVFEIKTKENGHNEPHFHVKAQGFEGSYSLNTLKRIAGYFPPKLERKIQKWTSSNLKSLKQSWNEIHGYYRKVV